MILLTGAVAFVPAPASAHCEEITEEYQFEEGGGNWSAAQTIESGDYVELGENTGQGRWFKIYVEEPGSAVVPSDWCVKTDNDYTFSLYKETESGTDKIGKWGWKEFNEEYAPQNLPTIAESGWYYMYIDFDRDYSAEETHVKFEVQESSNRKFEVAEFQMYPSSPAVGEEVTSRVTVSNTNSGLDYTENKTGDFADNATVRLKVGSRVVGTKWVTLAEDQSTDVEFDYSFTADESGDVSVTAEVVPTWAETGTTETKQVNVELNDLDGDGLIDSREEELGTDPRNADTDGDGVKDEAEIEGETDALEADTDGDGLDDGGELDVETDPTVVDTDGDGVSDGEEGDIGSDPLTTDTDGDGLDDATEVEEETDPTSEDTDGDGLADKKELSFGSDPTKADTDGDGLPDDKESELGTDPADEDTDGDGRDDASEVQKGLDPVESETVSSSSTTAGEQAMVDAESLNVASDRVNLLLRGEKTVIGRNESAILTFSAANLISNDDPMHVQLIIETPSGVSVKGTGFVDSGSGQYVRTITLDPGDTKGLEINLEANEPGRFGITGHAVYYLGEDKENATSKSVTIPLQVLTEKQAKDDGGSETESTKSTSTPGFGVGAALFALALFGYFGRRR